MNTFVTIPDHRRVVIKVGSTLIAPEGRGCSTRYLLAVAQWVQQLWQQGKEVIIVSSGGVAAGLADLPDLAKQSHRSIAEKQALAAIGQSRLMTHWQKLFDRPCGQILLTRQDLEHRRRFLNARNTLETLLSLQVLPIVNENDTVAVEELKVGDNDTLAAHVSVLSAADMLVILSDVEGLYDADPSFNPHAKRLANVKVIDDQIKSLAGDSSSGLGTGGMKTKLQAAQIATDAGIHTLVISGRNPKSLLAFQHGQSSGTWFHARLSPLQARKHWILHNRQASGSLVLDDGAAQAVQNQGASLLPKGIEQVVGQFTRGDVVQMQTRSGVILGCGVMQYDAQELAKIQGCHSRDIMSKIGYYYTDVVIHRNDMVLNKAGIKDDA